MARTFDGVDDFIRFTHGAGVSLTACTLAVLCHRSSDTGTMTVIHSGGTAGTNRWSLSLVGTAFRARSAASTVTAPTITVAASEGYCLLGWNKAAGTSTPRFHKLVLSTGVVTHENGASTLPDSTGLTNEYLGCENTIQNFYAGDIAIAGVFSVSLSDAQFENLAASARAWLQHPATSLWVPDQSAVTQEVPNLAGFDGGNQGGILGTSVATGSVPFFGYGAHVMEATPSEVLLVSPTSIAPAVALGSVVVIHNKTVLPNGVVSLGSIGTPRIVGYVAPAAIASSEAIGTPTLSFTGITPSAIASAESFGSPTLHGSNVVDPVAISSAGAFGTPLVLSPRKVVPVGIPGADAEGTPSVSGVSVGKKLTIRLNPGHRGIPSASAVGTPKLTPGVVTVTGIASAQAVGTPRIVIPQFVVVTGIGSAEALGTPGILLPDTVAPVGIASRESVGTPLIVRAGTIEPIGIASLEAFGTPELVTLEQTVLPEGIASAEVVNAPTVLQGAAHVVTPAGIGTGATFGTVTVSVGPSAPITPWSIISRERFGLPRITVGIPAGPVNQPPGRIANRLYDPETGVAFAFAINHSDEDPRAYERQYEPGGPGAVGLSRQQSSGDLAHLSFRGTILDPEQKTAIDTLFEYCDTSTLIYEDYSGEAYEVIIGTWDCREERARNPLTRALHLWRYTIDLVILRVLHGPVLNVIGATIPTPPDITILDPPASRRLVGIASKEAFGALAVLGGDPLLAPPSIPSRQAFGGLVVVGGDGPSGPAPPGSTLVFEDNFDGSAVDTTKWAMYNSPGHAGHGLRRPSAFSVADGILTITAQMVDGQVVSGGMSRRTTQMYGYYETRMRVEVDPAGVMSGLALTYAASGNGTTGGENDFYETGHAAGTRVNPKTFIHYPDPSTGANRQFSYTHPVDATDWHTVRMDWRADHINIWRDGVLVWSLTGSDMNLIPDQLHKMCLQLDAMIGGVALTQPVRAFYEYVRIWD